MGEFIRVAIVIESCAGIEKCGECVKVCPVNVFEAEGNIPSVVESNEDECTLCDLCIEACKKDALKIYKLYES
jgi:NAD-dependent dihydropyrimidine dehydrogenase PreA subunit